VHQVGFHYTDNFSKINFSIIVSCTLRSVQLSLLISLPNKSVYAVSFSCLLRQVHICPLYCILLDLIILIISSEVCALHSLLCSLLQLLVASHSYRHNSRNVGYIKDILSNGPWPPELTICHRRTGATSPNVKARLPYRISDVIVCFFHKIL